MLRKLLLLIFALGLSSGTFAQSEKSQLSREMDSLTQRIKSWEQRWQVYQNEGGQDSLRQQLEKQKQALAGQLKRLRQNWEEYMARQDSLPANHYLERGLEQMAYGLLQLGKGLEQVSREIVREFERERRRDSLK